MKIVCDSCSAKYSIADEKVAGKVFKIRCKKCSSVIVVRGDQMPAEPAAEAAHAAAASQPPPDDAIWHVVVAGDQQGPYTPVQVGELLSAGTIDWEAYVWREGFDGWAPARDVAELVEAVTGQPAQQPASASQPPAAGADMGADPFGVAADAGGDNAAGDGLFGAGTGESLFGGGAGEAAHSRDAGADLFARSQGSPFGAVDGAEAAAAAGGGGGDDSSPMTGQRNENSVLFSLSNLQALATGPGPSQPPTSSGAASMPAPSGGSLASGEGSGLIDIKALASATGVGASAAAGSGGHDSGVDDLLSIGAGSPGFGSALGAPVLAPVEEERSNKGMLFAVVGAGGLVAVAAIVLAVVFLTKEDEPVAAAGATAGATGAINPGTATGGTPPAAGEGSEAGSQAAAAAAAPSGSGSDSEGSAAEPEEDSGERAGSEESGGSRERRTGRTTKRSGSSGSSDSPAPAAAPAAATTKRGGSDIDSLLEQALGSGGGGGGSRPAASRPSAAASNLPDAPPRDAVLSALRSVQGAVSSCGGGQHGVADTRITVSGTNGRVTRAVVSGQFAGTPVGSCVARAVRAARFPRFSRPTFSVSFPYRI